MSILWVRSETKKRLANFDRNKKSDELINSILDKIDSMID